MTLSLNDSNKDFDFVGWVITTSWLIYFRSVKFHYVKETHMMLVALVKIIVASQHKRRTKTFLHHFEDSSSLNQEIGITILVIWGDWIGVMKRQWGTHATRCVSQFSWKTTKLLGFEKSNFRVLFSFNNFMIINIKIFLFQMTNPSPPPSPRHFILPIIVRS